MKKKTRKRRKGGGRKSIDAKFKREVISVRLPAWLCEWLKSKGNVGRLIEDALKSIFIIEEPEK